MLTKLPTTNEMKDIARRDSATTGSAAPADAGNSGDGKKTTGNKKDGVACSSCNGLSYYSGSLKKKNQVVPQCADGQDSSYDVFID